MLVKPVTNQIITNKIQNNHRLRIEKKELSAEPTMTALPSYADAKSFVNISFKARIHDCAENGYLEGVKWELDKGVDVNLRDERGWTALKQAAFSNKYSIVKNLLQYPGIDVNAKSSSGMTALMSAVQEGYTDITIELLKHPAIDVNLQDYGDKTALIWASFRNNPEAIRELLKYPNIDVNLQDNRGNTALILASYEIHEDVIAELLKHPDIDVKLTDKFGKTAEDYADGKIRMMIQNYVRGVDKREEVLPKQVLTGKVDISKLTSFDEIWAEEEKQNLEKLIETKDFKALAKLFESKGTELNEKYRYLITDTDKLKEQIKKETRTSETEKIRKEEKANAQKAIQDKIAELEQKENEYEEKSIALDNIMKNFQDLLAENIASERETLASGIRALYGIQLEELPENMNFGEQMVYVTNVLLSRQNKLTGTDKDTPEKITKALQDRNGRISNDGLKFLERVIDTNNGKCSVNDITDAIEAVKNNHGLIDTGAVALFISSLSWAGNTIRSATEKVAKYCINVKK